jgi:hypothetical protein
MTNDELAADLAALRARVEVLEAAQPPAPKPVRARPEGATATTLIPAERLLPDAERMELELREALAHAAIVAPRAKIEAPPGLTESVWRDELAKNFAGACRFLMNEATAAPDKKLSLRELSFKAEGYFLDRREPAGAVNVYGILLAAIALRLPLVAGGENWPFDAYACVTLRHPHGQQQMVQIR